MVEAGELVGSYRYAGNSGTIQLDLRDDKSFTETIIFHDGRREVRRGTCVKEKGGKAIGDDDDGQGCSAVGIKPRVKGQDHASEALPQTASVEDKYESTLAEGASDFVAGAGDSFSFGLTRLARIFLPGGEQANPCSQAYGYQEKTVPGKNSARHLLEGPA